MSVEKEDIRKSVLAMMEGKIPLNSAWCTVKTINGDTCDVIFDDDENLIISDILLGFDKSGVIVKPIVNTDVLVLFINNTRTNGAVVMVEETDGIEIMGNEFDGIPKVAALLSEINDLKTVINDLKTVFTGWTPVPNDGGAALKAAVTAWASQQLQPTQQSTIENDKVKHGKG